MEPHLVGRFFGAAALCLFLAAEVSSQGISKYFFLATPAAFRRLISLEKPQLLRLIALAGIYGR